MNDDIRQDILAMGQRAHSLTETAYQQHPATKNDPDWLSKQGILLADMSLHLLQTALHQETVSSEELKRNLYSILTISEQFLPEHGLKECADRLYQNTFVAPK